MKTTKKCEIGKLNKNLQVVLKENDKINSKARRQAPTKTIKATKMAKKKKLDWETLNIAIFRYFCNGSDFTQILSFSFHPSQPCK